MLLFCASLFWYADVQCVLQCTKRNILHRPGRFRPLYVLYLKPGIILTAQSSCSIVGRPASVAGLVRVLPVIVWRGWEPPVVGLGVPPFTQPSASVYKSCHSVRDNE